MIENKEEHLVNRLKHAKEILQILEYCCEWKVLCLAMFFSSAILIACNFPYVCNILGTMFETIRAISFLIFLLALTSMAYKGAEALFFYCKAVLVKECTKQAKAQIEAAEISEVGELLSSLPDTELSILKYMHNKGGVTWLPIKEGAVLNLNSIGCIQFTLGATMLRGELLGEHSQCFPCKLTAKIENNFNRLQTDIQERLSHIESASWLAVYEHALEG